MPKPFPLQPNRWWQLAPLIIENQLLIKGTYLIWETPKTATSVCTTIQQTCAAVSACSSTHGPDGFDLEEPQRVLVSEGYSSRQAGTQGKQRLPDKFHVARAGSEPEETSSIEFTTDVRMFVPLWLVNTTNLPIGAVMVTTWQQPHNKEVKEAGASIHGGMQTAAKSSTLRAGAPGAVTMMAYPMQRMTAFKQQGDRPQFFGLCLRRSGEVPGESCAGCGYLLVSSGVHNMFGTAAGWGVWLGTTAASGEHIPDWGTVHEVVARVEMAGAGFERTMVLRLEPHCIIPNRTGTPVQIMHFSTGNKLQRLGGKATQVQPSRGQQPQRAPPGVKGVVANPQQDWTSCIDAPTGALGVAVHWSMKSDSWAVCLRFGPQTAGSGVNAPWSHPIEASLPGGWTAMWPSLCSHLSLLKQLDRGVSAEEADQQASERSMATLLTGMGPSWELHGPRVARRLRHRSRQSGNGGEGPEAMEEVEAVILHFSLAVCNLDCMHLVLESVSPKGLYLQENRTAHPFQYRQAGLGETMPGFHMAYSGLWIMKPYRKQELLSTARLGQSGLDKKLCSVPSKPGLNL
ncbi:TPA: hypothetical protein ACH3X2_010565 [Trebouxia sp. C0005]